MKGNLCNLQTFSDCGNVVLKNKNYGIKIQAKNFSKLFLGHLELYFLSS